MPLGWIFCAGEFAVEANWPQLAIGFLRFVLAYSTVIFPQRTSNRCFFRLKSRLGVLKETAMVYAILATPAQPLIRPCPMESVHGIAAPVSGLRGQHHLVSC